MKKITNKQKGPIQLVIKSRRAPRSFTTLNIPGVGRGRNVYFLEDERTTDYIDRAAAMKLIEVDDVADKTIDRRD